MSPRPSEPPAWGRSSEGPGAGCPPRGQFVGREDEVGPPEINPLLWGELSTPFGRACLHRRLQGQHPSGLTCRIWGRSMWSMPKSPSPEGQEVSVPCNVVGWAPWLLCGALSVPYRGRISARISLPRVPAEGQSKVGVSRRVLRLLHQRGFAVPLPRRCPLCPWLLPVPFSAHPLCPPAPLACRAWLVPELCCPGQDLLPPTGDAGTDLGIPQLHVVGERAWKLLAPAGCCDSRLLAPAQVFPSICELNPGKDLARGFPPRSHHVPRGCCPRLSLEPCML